MHGGDRIAEVLHAHGVPFLFTLCGGHISPILVGCKQRGIRVVDVRHEVTAVFAADAVGRLTGTPGVAAVTAGPGVTNTITAVKNAQQAHAPLVLLVGATATALRGRGALQDIDQQALLRPHVKAALQVKRVRDLAPAVGRALALARDGVPGPVSVECPLDLLYDEQLVRGWYGGKSESGGSLSQRMINLYLQRHVRRLFAGADAAPGPVPAPVSVPSPDAGRVLRAARRLEQARSPLLLVGSQALLEPGDVTGVARAIERLGVPVYLAGMTRGLLGPDHPLQLRHGRRNALRDADLVILAGLPCDFRLDYGRQIRRGAFLVSANRSRADLRRNRRPDLAVHGDAGRFLRRLSESASEPAERWSDWLGQLRERDETREATIREQAEEATEHVNPLYLCRELESCLADDSVLVADGGDFVATASYIVRPRGPLGWLDPGVFGTLGVGAGFALGAKLCRPDAEVWILYGDGSLGFSLSEFDTFVRHGLPVLALVGNDACWMQIKREQGEMLGDDVGCALRRTDYEAAAEGLGARGFAIRHPGEVTDVLRQAKRAAAEGRPVLINAHVGQTGFRKGSISV